MLDSMKNRFSSAEENADGTWAIFNDVQGLFSREVNTRKEAAIALAEMNQFYSAIENGKGA